MASDIAAFTLSVNKPLWVIVRSGTTGGSSVTSRESEPGNPARYPGDDPVTLAGTTRRIVIISPGLLEVNNQCNTIGLLFHLLVHTMNCFVNDHGARSFDVWTSWQSRYLAGKELRQKHVVSRNSTNRISSMCWHSWAVDALGSD